MMIFNEFTEEMRNEIKSAVKNNLLKLGINVDVTLSAETYRHTGSKEFITIKTTEFNTIPVIYKSIRIEGSSALEEDKETEGVYDLCIRLGYQFNYFNGSTNGVGIGTIYFRINEKDKWIYCYGFNIN